MDVDLHACISGDQRAWNAFVDRYSGVIVAAVRRAAGFHLHGKPHDSGDVDDLVQEVFVRLIKDDCRLLRTFDPSRASLVTWLTLVARSVAIERLRRKRIDLVELNLQISTGPTESHSAHSSDPPVIPIDLLTPRQRLVLRLLFNDGLTVPEAAGVLNVDEQTIRSTKHKGLERLRAHFSRTRDTRGRDVSTS